MAITITDTNSFEITIDRGDGVEYVIWKQNIRFGTINGNILPLFWHDKARADRFNNIDLDYTDVSSPVAAHAEDLKGKIQNMIRSGWDANVTVPNLEDVLDEGNDGGGNQIKNIADPADPQDAVTLAYFNARKYMLPISGITTNFNPANGQAYFISYLQGVQTTADTLARVYFAKTGTMKFAQVQIRVAGTLGSNQNITMAVRLNNTTDYNITTVGQATTAKGLIYTAAFNQAVTAQTDFVEFKFQSPTWSPNVPTLVFLNWELLYEPT